jgi:hypothetical protein
MSAFSPSLYEFLARPPSVEVAFGETVTTQRLLGLAFTAQSSR